MCQIHPDLVLCALVWSPLPALQDFDILLPNSNGIEECNHTVLVALPPWVYTEGDRGQQKHRHTQVSWKDEFTFPKSVDLVEINFCNFKRIYLLKIFH